MHQFSDECRKTEVITLVNHNRRRHSNQQVKARSKYMQLAPSAGNATASESELVLVLPLIGGKSSARYFSKLQSIGKFIHRTITFPFSIVKIYGFSKNYLLVSYLVF